MDISQQSLEITGKSDTTVVHDAGVGNLRITPRLEFNRIDDYISYKLVIRNNDGKGYQIIGITDDNSNEAVALSYSYPTEMDTSDKSIDFTVRYVKTTDSPLKTINVVVSVVDEDDETEDIPIVVLNTGANTSMDRTSTKTVWAVVIYAVFAIFCCVVYIIVRRKKNKDSKEASLKVPKILLSLALLIGFIPVVVIAADFENIYFTVNLTEVQLNGPYTVVFDTDDGTAIPPQIINNGDKVAEPTILPEKTGYDFGGWVDENGDPYDFDTPVTAPVTIRASWNIINYPISYNLNDGAVAEANPETYNIESDTFTLNNPTKAHYIFAGWTGTGLDEATETVTVNKGSTGERNYTATWEKEEYTATFKDGETVVATQTKKYEELFTTPEEPTKAGYNFGGWLLNGAAYDFDTPASEDIELTASWNIITYNIHYDLANGTIDPNANPATYTVETDDITLVNPTMEDHVFKGWKLYGSDENDPLLNPAVIAKGTTGDLHFIAHWVGLAIVEFDSGVEGMIIEPEEIELEIGSELSDLPNPVREHYTFDGWYHGDTKIEPGYIVNDDMSLLAKWIPVEYSITYDLDDGDANNPATYNIETPTFTLAYPTKSGYDFDGWTGTDLSGETKDVTITVGSTGPRSYTAHWTKLYTVTFDANNGSPTPSVQSIRRGETAIVPEEPIRADYIFKGWKLNGVDYDFGTPVVDDITLTAEWQVGKTTLALDGVEMLTRMKQLAEPNDGITAANSYTVYNDNVTGFVRADAANIESFRDKLTDANKISGDSVAATYMWFDDTTGTMYYYTEAAKVYIDGSMAKMFARFNNLNDLSGLKDFDTSGATDMNRLFQDSGSIDDDSIENLKDWDTSKVENMSWMFGGNDANKSPSITKLTALSGWDVSNVKSFNQMFKYCTNLTTSGELVDDPENPGSQIFDGLGKWDVSGISYDTTLSSNDNRGFEQMFNWCTGLSNTSAIVGWNVNNAITSAINNGKDISFMFTGMLRNTSVLTTQPAFDSWSTGGVWASNGTFLPNPPAP